MTNINTLSILVDSLGWQGGTIHQAKKAFFALRFDKQAEILEKLLDWEGFPKDSNNLDLYFNSKVKLAKEAYVEGLTWHLKREYAKEMESL